MLAIALLRTQQQLIVPSLFAVCVISSNVSRRGDALTGFPFPFDVRGCVLLEVEVSSEGEGEPLVEASLV